MALRTVVERIGQVYTSLAYALILASGLLTIVVERFLYARRRYRREAKITAVIGWTYIVGGTLAFLVIWFMQQYL